VAYHCFTRNVAILSQNFEVKNSAIVLTFGTIVNWMNTCEYSFFFQKFLDPWDPFCPKDLGHPRELKNDAIMLKFATLI